MRIWIILLCLAPTAARIVAQPVPFGCDHKHHAYKKAYNSSFQKSFVNPSIARSDTFDIVHYDINLDVQDFSGQHLGAHTTVTYAPKLSGVTVLNFDLKQLTVDSVLQEGGVLGHSHANDLLSIALPLPTVAGDTTAVTIYYQGTPYKDPEWGGFYFASGYIYNLGIGISSIPPNFGKVWYPCFDSFVERATYEYHVHTASDKTAYCQGILAGRDTLDDNSIISHYLFDYQIPTHLSAIAASNYVSLESSHTGVQNEIPIQLVCKPQDAVAMEEKFGDLSYAIDALEHWYGPYYYGRVGYILTTDGALEIPENIAYPQFMMTQGEGNNNRLLSHELGHHWWGDMVAPALHNHMWLKEGPAEYAAHLMTEWKDGRDAMITEVKNNQLYVLENAHVDDEGFWPLSPIPDEHIYGRHTYYKGASVMHNLRAYLGDTLYSQGMKSVLVEKLNDSMYPEEFRDILSAQTGVDLTSYFQDQIFTPGYSTFILDSVQPMPGGPLFVHQLHIRQALRAAPEMHTNVPLEVTAYDDQWNRHTYQVTVSGEMSYPEIQTDFVPLMWELNGNGTLNQARLDYTGRYDDVTGLSILPWVDFRLQVNSVTDSVLVRVEHQWVAPESDNLSPILLQLSSTHHWIISGLEMESTSLTGRVSYTGVNDYNLDYDLVNLTEEGITLAFRPTSSAPWTPYPHQTVVANNLLNGNGYIKIDSLLAGQYAFAKLDPNVSVSNLREDVHLLHPNPTAGPLVLSSNLATDAFAVEIIDMRGAVIAVKKWMAGSRNIDLSELSDGLYTLRFTDLQGRELETSTVVLQR